MNQITIGVQGMKCSMCESHICEQIRNRFAVKKVSASRRKCEVVIITDEDIARQEAEQLITQLGYTVTSFMEQPYQGRKWPWSR